MKTTTAILVAFLLLLGLKVLGAESFALVVGVNECPDFRLPDGGKPRALRGAEADAEAMAAALIKDFHFAEPRVQLLKGSQATAGGIRAAFEKLRTTMHVGDGFVFHFSGHGTLVSDRDGLHEALCPHDATEKAENLITGRDLAVWLAKLPAERVTLILDCCHAGQGLKDPDDDVAARFLPLATLPVVPKDHTPWAALRNSTKGVDRWQTAFFACHDDQQAYERRLPGPQRPQHRGQFTYYFLEALRQPQESCAPHDNRHLLRYVQQRLDATFNETRHNKNERQEPVLESDEPDGQVFGLSPVLPPTAVDKNHG